MPARVYECDESEVKALKKILSYDPYLDPNLIPKSREVSKEDLARMGEAERKAYLDAEAATQAAIKKLREDKFANVIFARQDCDMREGKSIGVEDSKSYLLVKATEEFLDLADERFKREFKTVKRAPREIESKFIALKEQEESAANAGFGSIFG